MPISHKYKAIFVHIPKTGGASIEKALGIYGYDNEGSNKENAQILYGFSADPNKALQHLTATEIKGITLEDNYKKYFKFAFVRNPYDRILSEYFWQKMPEKNISFKDFLANEVRPNKDRKVHYRCQYEFITDNSGNMIVDFMGRYEYFNRDLKYVRTFLGFNKDALHLHKSKGRAMNFTHYSDYYDDQAKKLVYDMYKRDLEMFCYRFETPNFIQRVLIKIRIMRHNKKNISTL